MSLAGGCSGWCLTQLSRRSQTLLDLFIRHRLALLVIDISSTAQFAPFVLLETTMESLPSRLFTEEATLNVDANVEDHPNCELPQLSCRTLEIDFASLKATKSHPGHHRVCVCSRRTNFSVCFCINRLTPTHVLLIRHQLSSSLGSSVTTTITCCISSSAPLISPTLSSSSQQGSWNFDFSGISFTESSSNDAPTGTLVFVSGSSIATQSLPSRFPLINSETDENKFWGVSDQVLSSVCFDEDFRFVGKLC
ncbi:hypothetical protein BLNAU_17811 [Blattamonas nauphoetae]|uniref:Uncharacterized protein n=1 Tax=Blattamonas nauphoetae TaxID=2049346 RepID=A0ABQ9X6C4_9EUKA|nr:hypothetical protein BLNAU_17811 [Blattamonas nauphoetae]